ncbi:MAG TPA: hypothetical protein DEO83_03005 [Lachnospiraceae bacterium]|nr:hypothetical protein [Lachnospiraceae bacterium]
MKEKKESSKLNILGYVFIVAAFAVMCAGFLVTVRYSLMKQHVSISDGDYLLDKGLWVRLLESMARLLNMSELHFIHVIVPAVFLVLLFIIYIGLGICIFSVDGRGKVYTLLMTFIFGSVMYVILHVSSFSRYSLEAGVYTNQWQGRTIAGMLFSPILIMFFTRVRKDPDTGRIMRKGIIAGLLVTLICMIIIQGIDGWRTCSLHIKEFSGYFDRGWLFIIAVIGMISMTVMKKPAVKAVIAGSLVMALFFVPIPIAVMAAYAMTELIGEVVHRKSYVSGALVYIIILVMVLGAGLFSESRISWNVYFSPIENEDRLPQGIIDAMEAAEDDVIYTSYDVASVIKQYDAKYGVYYHDVYGVWDELPMKGHDISQILDSIRDEKMCVIIKNVTAEDRLILQKEKIWFVGDYNGYSLYRR